MLNLEIALNEAEDAAWRSLAKYKFIMFGYWVAMWVNLNRIDEFNGEGGKTNDMSIY